MKRSREDIGSSNENSDGNQEIIENIEKETPNENEETPEHKLRKVNTVNNTENNVNNTEEITQEINGNNFQNNSNLNSSFNGTNTSNSSNIPLNNVLQPINNLPYNINQQLPHPQLPSISQQPMSIPINMNPMIPPPIIIPNNSNPQMSMSLPMVQQIPPINTNIPINVSGSPVGAPIKQVKFENALDFLDQVKLQFATQPKVYNQFLEIMKDFKAQCIDTPGVIARVSELFKGHKNLILGFNTFLPPGYKIEYVPDDTPSPQPIQVIQSQQMQQQLQQNANITMINGNQAQNNTQRKQPEFDHARNYVKKIKMRFALQPQIYKAFLEILHTYHKEQHTIKDVYEQVATLFQNHVDLLEEFTQFLPDPIASSTPPVAILANRNKQKAGNRGKAKVVEKQTEKLENIIKPIEKIDKIDKSRKPINKKKEKPEEKVVPNGSYEELNFFYRLKQRLNNPAMYHEFLKCLNLFSQGIVSRIELAVLTKDLLARHRDLYDWFKQFIGFDENIIAEYLEKAQEEKLPPQNVSQQLTPSQQQQINQQQILLQQTQNYKPDIDFKLCKRYGPSYRALPKNFFPPICSGRNELCSSVLNDNWVSVPTGSEDYGFKNMRKNQYEEMLFKCEDDRYELDLVIELNTSTIRTLEPVLKSLTEMGEEDLRKFRLDTALDGLQVRSIERVYGEKGPDVVDALYANPLLTIPVILKRLKQKDQEWSKARREWNKIWREVNEKNYYKSLDHQSFYFKQNDKKYLNPKEIKQKYHEQLKQREKNLKSDNTAASTANNEKNQNDSNDAMEITNEVDISKEDILSEDSSGEQSDKKYLPKETLKGIFKNNEPKSYHLKYKFPDPNIFNDMFDLISFYSEKTLSKSDKEKMDIFFKHFYRVFFNVPESKGVLLPVPGVNKETKTSLNSTSTSTNSAPTPMDTSSETEKENTKRVYNVFYGNSTFYVIFREFQILYERLNKAKEFSKKSLTNQNLSFLMNPSKGNKIEDDAEKYKYFVKLVFELLSASKDQNVYEDELRSLFGIQSYVLFTLDRLIIHITKQIQSLLVEENSSKLLALFSHSIGQSTSQTNESTYYSRCIEVLDDERCYRVEYEKSLNYGDFTIQLLDSYNNPPQFVDVEKEKWSQYVEKYLGSEDSDLDVKKHHVFLTRNVNGKNDEDVQKNVEMVNGLECRISLSNFRIFYIANTTDYMKRIKPKQNPVKNSKTNDQKREHLEQILKKKISNKMETN